jgi:uncharacterized membrane protein YbhN (UPF0104 family)
MSRLRWFFAAFALVSLVLAVRFAVHFPWAGTVNAIAGADWLLLAAASLANIASLLAKGWAWHLVLLPSAPHRWRTAQAATLVAAAVNSVSVSLSGEVARVQLVATRDGVPLRAGIWSLVWSRVIEAVSLVLFLAAVLAMIPTAPWMRPIEIGAWVVLGILALAWPLGAGPRLLGLLPARLQPPVQGGSATLTPRRLAAPLALSVANWGAQWLSFYWAFAATHVSTSAVVSLSALVMANLGGIVRITPGNVGVLQASLALGMLAFGIPGDQALAAGLALQAVQVIPVVAIGVALVGAQGLRSLGTKRAETVGTA